MSARNQSGLSRFFLIQVTLVVFSVATCWTVGGYWLCYNPQEKLILFRPSASKFYCACSCSRLSNYMVRLWRQWILDEACTHFYYAYIFLDQFSLHLVTRLCGSNEQNLHISLLRKKISIYIALMLSAHTSFSEFSKPTDLLRSTQQLQWTGHVKKTKLAQQSFLSRALFELT